MESVRGPGRQVTSQGRKWLRMGCPRTKCARQPHVTTGSNLTTTYRAGAFSLVTWTLLGQSTVGGKDSRSGCSCDRPRCHYVWHWHITLPPRLPNFLRVTPKKLGSLGTRLVTMANRISLVQSEHWRHQSHLHLLQELPPPLPPPIQYFAKLPTLRLHMNSLWCTYM